MIKDLMYIELKTGYSDDGPAWIGYVKTSKTKKTIYFNNHAFQKYNGNYANYIDIENGDEYWISGLKKKESNRHWAGHGKIMIDRRAVNEYLTLIDEKELPLNLFEIIDIEDRFPVERVNKLLMISIPPHYHSINIFCKFRICINDFTTYVVTHNQKTSSDKINFTNESSVDLVKKLREESGKDIWICGGATLIQQGRYN